MNINRVEVLILNHTQKAVEKFGRNSPAVRYYQEGESSELINDLYQHCPQTASQKLFYSIGIIHIDSEDHTKPLMLMTCSLIGMK